MTHGDLTHCSHRSWSHTRQRWSPRKMVSHLSHCHRTRCRGFRWTRCTVATIVGSKGASRSAPGFDRMTSLMPDRGRCSIVSCERSTFSSSSTSSSRGPVVATLGWPGAATVFGAIAARIWSLLAAVRSSAICDCFASSRTALTFFGGDREQSAQRRCPHPRQALSWPNCRSHSWHVQCIRMRTGRSTLRILLGEDERPSCAPSLGSYLMPYRSKRAFVFSSVRPMRLEKVCVRGSSFSSSSPSSPSSGTSCESAADSFGPAAVGSVMMRSSCSAASRGPTGGCSAAWGIAAVPSSPVDCSVGTAAEFDRLRFSASFTRSNALPKLLLRRTLGRSCSAIAMPAKYTRCGMTSRTQHHHAERRRARTRRGSPPKRTRHGSPRAARKPKRAPQTQPARPAPSSLDTAGRSKRTSGRRLAARREPM